MKHNIVYYTLAGIALLALSSCKTQHDLAYFQNLQGTETGSVATTDYTYQIEPENELIITVKSSVPEASQQFNLPYTNPTPMGTKDISSASTQQQTYEVDNKGNIDFPVLGKIHVAGLTTYQLKEELERRISEYVKDPIVTVTLLGYQISVIGEVRSPHTIYTRADRYSILNALADCGDMTEYAKRDRILVMRRGENGKFDYAYLDLHSSDIAQSPYFWLKNNDVVIIEPNKIRQDNAKYNQNNGYKLSVISTIVSVASVIASLIIALTVK